MPDDDVYIAYLRGLADSVGLEREFDTRRTEFLAAVTARRDSAAKAARDDLAANKRTLLAFADAVWSFYAGKGLGRPPEASEIKTLADEPPRPLSPETLQHMKILSTRMKELAQEWKAIVDYRQALRLRRGIR